MSSTSFSSSSSLSSSSLSVSNDSRTVEILDDGRQVRIGRELAVVNEPSLPELVPQTVFYDIPSHVEILETMLRDWKSGERYSLLIGNQGTGKNKITDRLLQLLQLEREYMQLHRDTTIPHLTSTPTLVDGVRVHSSMNLPVFFFDSWSPFVHPVMVSLLVECVSIGGGIRRQPFSASSDAWSRGCH